MFETTTDSLSETAAAATDPMIHIISDRGDKEDFGDSSPSPKCTCRSDNPSDLNSSPQTSTGSSTNHNVFVSSFGPTSIEIEELDISIWTTRPASLRLLKPLSNDASDFLTDEHVPMLQQFFYFDIVQPSGGFVGTLAHLACQFWDLM